MPKLTEKLKAAAEEKLEHAKASAHKIGAILKHPTDKHAQEQAKVEADDRKQAATEAKNVQLGKSTPAATTTPHSDAAPAAISSATTTPASVPPPTETTPSAQPTTVDTLPLAPASQGVSSVETTSSAPEFPDYDTQTRKQEDVLTQPAIMPSFVSTEPSFVSSEPPKSSFVSFEPPKPSFVSTEPSFVSSEAPKFPSEEPAVSAQVQEPLMAEPNAILQPGAQTETVGPTEPIAVPAEEHVVAGASGEEVILDEHGVPLPP